MTLEELQRRNAEAGWLIARRSASAAGKALLFNVESIESTNREIAAIYGLSDEESARLLPGRGDGAVANVQKVANGLLGQDTGPNGGQAIKVARTAIQNGHAAKMLATLVKAGPKAAQAAASGGSVAAKGTPWGWIATAGYAVGTAGWFAYSARDFSLQAFQLVLERDGLRIDVADAAIADAEASQAPDDPAVVQTAPAGVDPSEASIASRARGLGSRVGETMSQALGSLRRSSRQTQGDVAGN